VTSLLKPIEFLWRGMNRLRRALYRRGILKSKRLPRPVISVGNLSAGGAGKTPAVITIARYLAKRGFRVAVLTRGYGRTGNDSGLITSLDAARFGDEPVLIKSKLKNVDVIVGSNRYENAIRFLNQNDCDLFVLDDGFQHLQLARDVDVVIELAGVASVVRVAPAASPASAGEITGEAAGATLVSATPASASSAGIQHSVLMREGRSALADADFVIQRDLRLVVPEGLTTRPIFAFAGLANNEQFFDSLRALGLNVTGTKGFKDHHRYSATDIAALKKAAGTAALVTTEKDAVKIDDRDIIAIAAEMIVQPGVLEAIAARISR
jgi:tetraacyldisaccharide 4'-kinase